MNKTTLLLTTCCAAFLIGGSISQLFDIAPPSEAKSIDHMSENTPSHPVLNVKAGAYLASRFAQNNHDWKSANTYLDSIISAGITEEDLLNRSMVLAMGSGDPKHAIVMAKRIKEHYPDSENTIADVFLIVDAIYNNQFESAQSLYKTLPHDGTVRFIGPFLKAWISAGLGETNIKGLTNNTVQLYHSILISDFLDDYTEIEKLIDKALSVEDINTLEIERIADLYGHVGLKDKAVELYNTVLKTEPKNENIQNKISALKGGTEKPLFKEINSANDGIAQAFHDLAKVLFEENNDESARVFSNIALYLSPNKSDTTIILAEIDERHEHYDNAITQYASIPKSDENYILAQHKIVDIYDDMKEFGKALDLLEDLSKGDQDVDTLIKIGDLYRHQEKYGNALKTYETAIKKLGGTVPEEYWHLYYVKGIAYEQSNEWSKAEKALKAALDYKPDHPYVLNYLGYAWADQGVNLREARDMIQRAVNLRPNDGYITDSLGWVMYRMNDYSNSARILERAVELLPYDPTINDHLGDAYWMVGRHREARFQWERAKNHSDDMNQVSLIEKKLISGLQNKALVQSH